MIRRFIITASLLVLLLGVLSLTGCGTWQGFGEDVEDLGEGIQDEEESSVRPLDSPDAIYTDSTADIKGSLEA